MAGFFASLSATIILGALISIAILAMTILLGIWTYRDATSKGLNGILWTLVVILVPSFIGLIIYLIIRIDSRKVTCSKCMQKVNGSSKFCSKCGEELIPVVEVSEDDEKLKKSQKGVLIGFFSCLGGIVVATILMVTFILTGVVSMVSGGVKLASKITEDISNIDSGDVANMLKSLDMLFDESGFDISVNGDEVIIKTGDGEEIIHVSGADGQTNINTAALYRLLEEHGIEYDKMLSEDEINEAVDEYVDKYTQNIEDMGNQIDNLGDEMEKAVDGSEEAVTKAIERSAEEIEKALKGTYSLDDFEDTLKKSQKIDIYPAGSDKAIKTITGEKDMEEFMEKLDMDDWDSEKLPEDAKELGTISFTSEYKGTNDKMNEFKVFNITVYDGIPYAQMDVFGIKISLKMDNEAMEYVDSLFQ